MSVTPDRNSQQQKPQAADMVEHRTLTGFVLYEASRFNHSDSLNASTGISFTPAVIAPSGDWRAAKDGERVDGFGVSQKTKGTNGAPRLSRAFFPLTSIKELLYSE